MPRKYIPRPKKHWNGTALQNALAERKELGTSIRKLAVKYGIPKLRFSVT